MKPGQTVMTYADPINQTHQIGYAKLIELVKDHGALERWKVEYVEGPTNECEILIKKSEHKIITTNKIIGKHLGDNVNNEFINSTDILLK